MRVNNLLAFVCVILVTIFASCSKGGSSSSPQSTTDTSVHVTTLSMTTNDFSLLPGGTQQLQVVFTPANTTDKKLSWSSSNTSVATVDANGLVTAVAPGTATVTAASVDRPSVKVIATVTVTKNYEVYVVGNGPSQNYLSCALLWKNGAMATPLTGGFTTGTNAYAITSSGSDIYIAGSTVNDHLWNIATYWKNGVAVQLSNPLAQSVSTSARAIAVSGGTVYVAGFSYNSGEYPVYVNGRSRAYYWTANGSTITEVPLFKSIASTRAFGLALSGSNVIVAGSRANDNFDTWAAYWKNDTTNETRLSTGRSYFEATAVAVNGADIYVTGYGGCPDVSCVSSAKLWKNDINNVVTLTNGATEAQATAIALSNGVVHVCGYEKNSQGKSVARYWKVEGTTVSSYSLTGNTYDAMAKAITVVGDDVFVAGYEKDAQGKKVAKYWRFFRGVLTATTLPVSSLLGATQSEANGILVK